VIGTTPAIAVRAMSPADIGAVVRLQTAFLEGSIVTELGSGFLETFHAAALGHPSSRALVALDGAHLAGFLLASTDVHAFNRHVRSKIVWATASALLSPRRWRLVPSICRGLVEREPEPPIAAELLLLVVAASYRRRGIAKHLIASLHREFQREGIAIYRVAVRSHLTVARAFYLATGFEYEQELTVLGQPMTYLTYRVSP
jgi:ribosomal protein S18 acetylase RimI-like enzyme